MKRIGIYLGSDRACGGSHQYNRVMLEALVCSLKNKFSLEAIYSAPHWKKILDEKNISAKYCPISRYSRWLIGIWRRMKLPLSLWQTLAKWVHPLARTMYRRQCDLWIFPSQDAFAYWMPVNALTTIHDLMHRYERHFPEVGELKEYGKREFHYANTCRYAKGILVDSKLGKQHVMESYAVEEKKCHVLPYVPPLEFNDAAIECYIRLPEKYIFYPAQFWKHKNHQVLLKAIAKLKDELPDLQLVLVGSAKNAFDEIKTLMQALEIADRVHILGLVEDQVMPELYRRARALVMPTFFGPTNIPPLEAWAAQCPVVISGIYAMKDQLGEAALYFDPNSISDVAEKIKQIWIDDELCKMLIQKGNERRCEINFDKFCATLYKIIEEILVKEKTC